jgi:hypothetical protein
MRKEESCRREESEHDAFMPLISPAEKANEFFHSVLHRHTVAMASRLGAQIPFISVYDGSLFLEFNNTLFTYSVCPQEYDELKSLIHALCAFPFCGEVHEQEKLREIILENAVWKSTALLPDHIAVQMHALLEEVRRTWFDTTPNQMGMSDTLLKHLGKTALLVARYIGKEQERLLENIWSEKIFPVIKGNEDQAIVIVGGNRSAEAGEIVTTFFRKKFSESAGIGASLEHQVMFCHSPKNRDEMRIITAQRLVSRQLGGMLFGDSFILQRDILSAQYKG